MKKKNQIVAKRSILIEDSKQDLENHGQKTMNWSRFVRGIRAAGAIGVSFGSIAQD